MTLRLAKVVLLCGLAFYYTLIVLNNVTDYDSNFQFVRHVFMMDSTFPGNRLMWRAINSPAVHTAFYVSIIVWEAVTMVLLWFAGVRLARAIRKSGAEFHAAKNWAVAALTLSLLLWFVAFLCIGGEWFLMWQSKIWNGQDAAFRMFCIAAITLLFVSLRDEEGQA